MLSWGPLRASTLGRASQAHCLTRLPLQLHLQFWQAQALGHLSASQSTCNAMPTPPAAGWLLTGLLTALASSVPAFNAHGAM